MAESRKTREEIFFFIISGLINTGINATAYFVLTYLGCHYLFSSFVGWVLGLINGYFFNGRITFRVRHKQNHQFKKYALVYLAQLGVSWAGLTLLIEIIGLNYYVAYCINVVVVTAVSFLGLKYFAFNNKYKVQITEL